MNKVNNKTKINYKDPLKILLIFLTAVTLYFNSTFQDPFNTPKFLILIVTGLWLLGYLFFDNVVQKINNVPKGLILTLSGFLVFLVVSTILSSNKYSAVFGENSRKNGLILYILFSIYLVCCIKFSTFGNILNLFKTSAFLLVVLVIYGLAQSQGIDFANWNNPYNSIILTMGNPNFAAALMAMLSMLVFAYIFMFSQRQLIRLSLILVFIASLYVIYLNGSFQGLASLAIGLVFFLGILLVKKSTFLGIIFSIGSGILGLFAVLGMMQKGPLESLLYKDSISVRGFYWRSSIKMFQDNFWFGVGPDNFGNFFRYYREPEYPLRYGFEITSNNAHNVFLQFFATGGIFVGLFYFLLNVFIIFKAIKCIRQADGLNLIKINAITSAWIVYVSQSIVSIDNVGMAIWGWVLAGIILGLSSNLQSKVKIHDVNRRKIHKFTALRPMFSGILIVLSLVPLSYIARGETSMMKTRALFNPNSNIQNSELSKSINSTLKIPLLDPYYKMVSADLLFRSGYPNEAKSIIRDLIIKNPNSADLLSVAAFFEETTSSFNTAIEFRERLKIWDPWNANNYLNLGRLYENIGNQDLAKKQFNKIIEFAPNSEQAKKALIELG